MNKAASTAVYDGGAWKISLQPQHAMLFKRVFDGVEKDGQMLRLSDTPKHARDLLWFSDRYPLDVFPLMRLLAQADIHTQRERAVEEILGDGYVPTDARLAIKLRDYQARAADLAFANGGLLLADDVGLGKTASAIGLFARRVALPAVVVTLTALPLQWQREVKKFAPELRTHVVKTGKPYPLDRTSDGSRIALPDVTVMSYSKLTTRTGLRNWAEKLNAESMARTVIFDEGQELRNNDSDRYRAARRLREAASYCMLTTATPVYNHGAEIHNVVEIVQPGALGTRVEFLREWCGRSDTEEGAQTNGTGEMRKIRVKDPIALGSHLRELGVFLRRTRADVDRQLPPLQRVMHMVDVDESVFAETAASLEKLCQTLLYSNNRNDRFTAAGELDWQMRRATGLAKALHVAHFVRMLVESGQKVVLYAWHHEVYDIFRRVFTNPELGDLRPAFYTGRESVAMKDRERARFIDGGTDLFIMSLRAGAGLDGLQHVCKTVVFAELDWSPGVHEQCLSADTEVLTDVGFRGVDAVREGDMVAGFDRETGAIRWVPALAKTDRPLAPGETMYACRTEKFDFRVTGEHRMVVRRKRRTKRGVERSPWEIELAQDLAGSSRRFVPVSGLQEAPGVPLTDAEIKLLGWFVTDGHFDGRALYFYQEASQPWNADLIETLNACDMRWSQYQRRNRSGSLMNVYVVTRGTQSRWSLDEVTLMQEMRAAGHSCAAVAKWLKRSPAAVQKKAKKLAHGQALVPLAERAGRGWDSLGLYLDKDLSGLLEAMTRYQLCWFLRGVHMGDGAKRAKNVYRITSTNRVFLDRLQSLCVRRGFSANISTRKSRTKAGKPIYDIWIADALEASLARPDKPGGFGKVRSKAGERVWCITNELGTLVTRRNGKVSILGNCEGRVFRDGQPFPVMVYYLVTNEGSDPVVLEALNLKTEQSEGIRNLTAEVARLKGSEEHMRKVALAYLRRKGKIQVTLH